MILAAPPYAGGLEATSKVEEVGRTARSVPSDPLAAIGLTRLSDPTRTMPDGQAQFAVRLVVLSAVLGLAALMLLSQAVAAGHRPTTTGHRLAIRGHQPAAPAGASASAGEGGAAAPGWPGRASTGLSSCMAPSTIL